MFTHCNVIISHRTSIVRLGCKSVEKNHKQAHRILSEPYVDGPATEIDVVIAIFFSYREGIQLHFSRRSWWEVGWMVQ